MRIALALLCAVATLSAVPAEALQFVSFEVSSTSWSAPNQVPFGLPRQPTLFGNLTADDTGIVQQLNYATGTRTWTQGDLLPVSRYFNVGGGNPHLSLLFSQGSTGPSSSTNFLVGPTFGFVGIANSLGQISCQNCVTVLSTSNSLASVPSSSLTASVIGSGVGLANFFHNVPDPTTRVNTLINCLDDDNSCDGAAAINNYQAANNTGISLTDQLAKSLANWVNFTGPPTSKAELIPFLVNDGPNLLDEVIDGLDLIKNQLINPNHDVSVTGVSGNEYAFSDAGYSSSFYDLTVDLTMSDSEINALALGDSFLTSADLGGGRLAVGTGTFTSLVDPPGIGTAQVHLVGLIESVPVPEPKEWALLLAGSALIGATLRRTRARIAAI